MRRRRLTALEIEEAAARLFSGYMESNDTDDDIADPIVRVVHLHWLGAASLPSWARPVEDLYIDMLRDIVPEDYNAFAFPNFEED